MGYYVLVEKQLALCLYIMNTKHNRKTVLEAIDPWNSAFPSQCQSSFIPFQPAWAATLISMDSGSHYHARLWHVSVLCNTDEVKNHWLGVDRESSIALIRAFVCLSACFFYPTTSELSIGSHVERGLTVEISMNGEMIMFDCSWHRSSWSKGQFDILGNCSRSHSHICQLNMKLQLHTVSLA